MNSSPNTIAFLCHPYHRGGVTSWMANAAYACAKQGINTYFVTVKPKSPFISGKGRTMMVDLLSIKHSHLHLISAAVSFEFELGTEEKRKITYKKLIEKFVPTGAPIIVSDDSSVWGSAALIAHKYPMIGVIHSSMDDGYFYLSAKYNKYLSKVICVSEKTRKNLFIRVPAHSFDTSVIPCGIPIDFFAEHNNTNDSIYQQINIIWTGRLEEISKRVSDIPKIAYLLKSKGILYNIQVIGHGDSFETLKKTIQENDLNNQITLLGWQEIDFIINAYKKADILLQTSNYEGMSVAVMEALASGCGVVSSRVSGVEDYEDTSMAKHCLRLYEIGNIEEAVEKIIEVSTITKSIRETAAKDLAIQKFSIESCIRKYSSVTRNAKVVSIAHPTQNVFLTNLKSNFLAILRIVKYKLIH